MHNANSCLTFNPVEYDMKNADLPAFANPGSDQGPGSSGLTKREYFAAMAMQGLMAVNNKGTSGDEMYTLAAIMAVRMADELLKKLEQ